MKHEAKARGLASAIAGFILLGGAAPAFGQPISAALRPDLLGLFFSSHITAPEGGSPIMYLLLGGLACVGGVVIVLRNRMRAHTAN